MLALRNAALSYNSLLGAFHSYYSKQTILTCSGYCRSVPTHDQILVPETLLKKRKSQEKQREERSAELDKKRKVRAVIYLQLQLVYATSEGEKEQRR